MRSFWGACRYIVLIVAGVLVVIGVAVSCTRRLSGAVLLPMEQDPSTATLAMVVNPMHKAPSGPQYEVVDEDGYPAPEYASVEDVNLHRQDVDRSTSSSGDVAGGGGVIGSGPRPASAYSQLSLGGVYGTAGPARGRATAYDVLNRPTQPRPDANQASAAAAGGTAHPVRDGVGVPNAVRSVGEAQPQVYGSPARSEQAYADLDLDNHAIYTD